MSLFQICKIETAYYGVRLSIQLSNKLSTMQSTVARDEVSLKEQDTSFNYQPNCSQLDMFPYLIYFHIIMVYVMIIYYITK